MSNIRDRIEKLERGHPAVSGAEFSAAMRALEERVLAKLRGDAVLPPEPPEWFLAECNRRVTPADIEEAKAKLLRLCDRKAVGAKVV
ncbi:MAG TPA: hypothetical protein VJL61_06730 [Rhodanobacteraceae bacterium]|nr:hypothetical protein [Rhodanobacteraceae bacterium]